jgi:branched-chain amino acid transport system substrate-binding protein
MSVKYWGKSRFASLFALSCAFLMLFNCQQNDGNVSTFRIGMVLPLTGDLATYGQNAREGAELAIKLKGGLVTDNPKLTVRQIKLVVEDSQGQPQRAVSALRKLIDVDKVRVVVGEISSSSTLAMAPIANAAKVVVVSPAASAPSVTDAGEFIFRTWPSDTFEITRMSQYIRELDKNRIAVLAVNNDYGQAMLRNLRILLEGSSVQIVASELFPQDPTDLRTQITKIKGSSAELIYLIGYPGNAVLFLKQYRELGGKLPVIATSSFEDPIVLEQKSAVAEGVVFTSPMPPDAYATSSDEFKAEFKKQFGHEPGLVADNAFDAVYAILMAVNSKGLITGDAIRSGLLEIKGFPGASGAITFDKNGDIVKPAGLKVVHNGKFEWLQR